MNDELKNVTKQSGNVFFGKIVGLFFGLIFNVLAARFLGAELFGQFTYIFTVISFLPIFAMLGLQQGLVYYIPKLTEVSSVNKRNQFITLSFVLVMFTSIIIILILIINKDFVLSTVLNSNNRNHELLLLALAPLILVIALTQLSQGVFRGIRNINPFVFNQNFIVPVVRIIIFTIVFLFLCKDILSIIVAFYFSMTIGFLYLLFIIYSKGMFKKFNYKTVKSFKQVLLYSLPLFFTGSLIFLSQKTDIFMLGYFLGDQEVGVYVIALQIGTMSSFILVAFNMIFAPTISSLYHKGDIGQLESMFKTITRWVVIVNVLAFGMILILNKEIMLLFGQEFKSGSTALVLVAIGQLVNAGVGSAGYILNMTGYPKLELYNNLVIVGLNITLNFMFIPMWGIEGAAIASLISVGTANLVKLILVYKIHRIHPYSKEYSKALIALLLSIVLGMFFYSLIDLTLILQIMLVSAFYLIIFSTAFILLGINDDDKKILNSLVSRVRN